MNKEQLWRKPTYLPYLQPPISEELIESAEKEIGYKLPTEYIALLKIQNGGYIKCALQELPHNTIAGIGPHYPSILHYDLEESQEWVSFSLNGLVPFDGDGHWYLCFDYRKNDKAPQITYIDLECDTQEVIAESFTKYLELLEEEIGDELVIDSGADIDSLIKSLSKALNVSFDPPDTFAHGYPVYRANLSHENSSEWLLISPNEVPDGFIRKDDNRYDELKSHMEKKAKRYPSLPKSAYICSMTDGVKDRVNNALLKYGVKYSYLKDVATNI